MPKISLQPRSPNAQGFLMPKVSYIYIILYLKYMYDSHIVTMTHAIIYMHHQYQYERYKGTKRAVNKQSDSTTPSCYLSRD